MRSVQYGDRTIAYSVQERPDLKAHYLSVDKDQGVVLKGLRLPAPQSDKLVLRKARWILEKLALVQAVAAEDIVTGSRITYLGRQYYTEVVVDEAEPKARITFNHSRFRIHVSPAVADRQAAIQQALTAFFRAKAEEKLTPRVRQWAAKTGLAYADFKVRTMEKRWGSCTGANTILLNPNVVKLPYTLIDYVIVHELCHTKVKDHSKTFWTELSQHLPQWKQLDAQLQLFK
ncbi:M48 family metallopeptidase [Hymenobacter sp. BT683]|uniref:M48 family metallopeptidase n=1 Tax=Hymenobacter jeongseonensis TaxID=2791027 RepID=A0ABS0IP21_9BACT|nr:SprT family zinc-dependent metalloprotease [Hymenobacter jeongseonensis]MBF9239794.1 M48 family metallopeptidase [Hymenobacter jeongseonensis]